MTQKTEITRKVLESLGLDPSEDRVLKTIPVWWYSTRQKENSGLRLTDAGFKALVDAGIKEYRIEFTEDIRFTNQLMIWLDNFIDCPFYLRKNEIFVFSEKMAVQLLLFSGNVYKYGATKAKRQSS